jgi:hypothetical protein
MQWNGELGLAWAGLAAVRPRLVTSSVVGAGHRRPRMVDPDASLVPLGKDPASRLVSIVEKHTSVFLHDNPVAT